MQSYLSQRSQVVNIRDTRSRCVQLPCGVPQGSYSSHVVFRPSALIPHIRWWLTTVCRISTWSTRPSVTAANRISRCITDVRASVTQRLDAQQRQNRSYVVSAANTRAHATVDVVIDVCGCVVTPAPYVRDIHSTMSMAKNVSRVCQMAYCQLRSMLYQTLNRLLLVEQLFTLWSCRGLITVTLLYTVFLTLSCRNFNWYRPQRSRLRPS